MHLLFSVLQFSKTPLYWVLWVYVWLHYGVGTIAILKTLYISKLIVTLWPLKYLCITPHSTDTVFVVHSSYLISSALKFLRTHHFCEVRTNPVGQAVWRKLYSHTKADLLKFLTYKIIIHIFNYLKTSSYHKKN